MPELTNHVSGKHDDGQAVESLNKMVLAKESIVSQRVTIGKVGDIPPGGSVVVTWNNKDIAIFHVDGAYYAIDDTCPHQGASLSGGHIEDGCVICPWHAWRFRLADGAWADNPRVKTGWYPVHVVGEEIQLEVPD